MSAKTYHGTCHCGAVRYRVTLDLRQGTGRCNCSICRKTRKWGAHVKPAAFELLAGDDVLGDYQFGTLQGHHRFCRRCGIHVFGHGHIAEIGGDFVSVNLGCLDDADDAELAAAPVRFFNGRDDAWLEPPAETRHL
ncbi:MAG: GFA family protein [Kofleriaceae bacterium]|nr:GFA family protein [Myxococcales bacterium]MCB1742158.1 GFA family protein [Gammaproteobacteria bacterium]MCB9564762.1 GFA family protein [Kofleriaceae bacterium]MCB9572811.1 GFA family protein [Kofleriaceae bacterium]